jgi:hypothetical protein
MTLRRPNWLAMLTVGLVLFGAGACEQVGSYDGVEEPAGAACDSEKEPDLPTQTPTAPPVPNIHLPADAVLVLATRCVFDLESVPVTASGYGGSSSGQTAGSTRSPRRCGCRTSSRPRIHPSTRGVSPWPTPGPSSP